MNLDSQHLTSSQKWLVALLLVLVSLSLILVVTAYFNVRLTSQAFETGYMVTDLSNIQRDVLRLYVATEQELRKEEPDWKALALRQDLLTNQLNMALAENGSSGNVNHALSDMNHLLDHHRELMVSLQSRTYEERLQALPGIRILMNSFDEETQALYDAEESLFFSNVSEALNSQTWSQSGMLATTILLIALNVLLALSVSRTISRDFRQAYGLLEGELKERKRVEAELIQAKNVAEEANRTKSDFISVVSHELRAPMTSIKGFADLMALGDYGPLTADQRLFVGTIQDNVVKMITMVGDLSDISRIEAGRLDLEFTQLPVLELVADVLQTVRPLFQEKEQRLQLEVPANLPALHADRVRLAQILTNLLSNAHKYSPAGSQINLSAAHYSGSNGTQYVEFSVADQGIGIAPDEQGKIFTKFFRSRDRQARRLPGSGLGLNIVRQLVLIHNGNIWFESTPGQGSCFHFTIPAVGEEDEED